MFDLNKWYKELREETIEQWNKYSIYENIKKKGFAIFYSPIKENPQLLIIGLNPGGGEKDFDPDKIAQIPKVHEYITENYNMAVTMRALFTNMGKMELLNASIKTNKYFFRTENEAEKNELPIHALEDYCDLKIIDIINKLEPKIILIEGVTVFDDIILLMNGNKDSPMLKENNFRLVQTGIINGIKVIGLIHPTGERTRGRFIRNYTEIVKILKEQL